MSIKDGLLAITNEVLSDVQKEAEAIILQAENEAKETLREAKEEADQSYKTIINQADIKAETERRKIASITEVENRNRLLQTKENLVDGAFEKAFNKLKAFTTTKQYQNYVIKLIEKVAKSISTKDIVIQVNTKDQAWLTEDTLDHLSKKIHCKLKLSSQSENFIGGFKIQTEDGKITYDSTIDSQLQDLKEALRVEVAKILFQEKV
jgi:vacuolar-type H+-ATPase subunit E/Vma4